MDQAQSEEERARRLAELVAWVATKEAQEAVRQATEQAQTDADLFLRMDRIEQDVHTEPMTL